MQSVTAKVSANIGKIFVIANIILKFADYTYFIICPDLIGGIRVEVDGRVIDGSIRNKLEEIKEVMNA